MNEDKKKEKIPLLGRKKKQKEIKKQIQKDDSHKADLRYFINQVDEKKFIPKTTKQKNQAKGSDGEDEDDEITQDEFLNKNEFSEIKGNYDDYNLGDVVIVFPNPDCDQPNKYVSFSEAEEHFDNVLTVITDELISKAQLKQERDSFLYAFLTLNDYKAGKAEREIERKRLLEEANLVSPEIVPTIDQDKKQGKTGNNQKRKEQSTYQKYIEFENQLNKNQQQQNLQLKKEKLVIQHQDEFEQLLNQEIVKEVENKFQYSDPIKELLKVDLTDVKQFSKVKKSWGRGKYLKKISADNTEWVCSNSSPKDYLTLVRFTVMSKLTRSGRLHTRTFIASDGTTLFMVIKSNRAVIMRQAQNYKITKQFELGYADLFSLEPCDSKFRPLRLKNYIRDYQNEDDVKDLLDKIQQDQVEQKRIRKLDEFNRKNKKADFNFSFDEKAFNNYQKIKKWKDIELRVNIILKQQKVDIFMKSIAKYLNYDFSQETVELIHDTEISRLEWEPYYIYMTYIINLMKKLEKFNKFKEVKQNQAFLYKLIFRKALVDSNQFFFQLNNSLVGILTGQLGGLKTLWDRLDVPPLSPFTGFFNPNNQEDSSMWRKFEINENGSRSEFSNVEKIKITNSIILKNINILKMLNLGLSSAYFPLHDPYQLKGISKMPFFKPLIQAGLMNEQVVTIGELNLKNLFSQMKDESESTDFDIQSLDELAGFNYKIPWSLPIDSMRDYFGEKIAMYFDFLKFYTMQLWYMAVTGVIAQGLIGSNSVAKNTIIIIFSIIIIVWSTFFIEFWKRQQVLFSVQFGQENFEEDEAIRPEFIGKFIRSITTDDLNEEYYSPFLRKMKVLLSLAISFIIIAMVIACVFGIFTLKEYLNSCNCVNDNQLIMNQVPAILNSIQIQIFNTIYQNLGMSFNNFENHKILSSYENSLIAKIFIFMFVNTFNSFFIIAYMNSQFKSLNLCKDGNNQNCFKILQTQMTIIFLVTFIKKIPELMTPLILAVMKKRNRQVAEKPVVHAFNKIDSFIEEQFLLEDYATNNEVDGTVGDYMELVIQFSFLSLFGLAFPVSFLLAFITNVAEIQVDKLKLTKFERRPFPQGASTIGNWLVILEVVTFMGIFTNAGLIVYTSDTEAPTALNNDKDQRKLVLFFILIIIFLGIKYLIRYIVPDSPYAAVILNKRHQCTVDHCFDSRVSLILDKNLTDQQLQILKLVVLCSKVALKNTQNIIDKTQ